MPGIARVVAEGVPHHVTRRGRPGTDEMFAASTKITNPLGHMTSITCDLDLGKPTAITDPNSNSTHAVQLLRRRPIRPLPLRHPR